MLSCYDGTVRLIFDIPCILGTVAGQKFSRFWPEPSQNQGSLHPAHQEHHCWTIYHFLHMAPMGGILAMLIRLCGADFGHAMPSQHSC
jgi:hypothetical protein